MNLFCRLFFALIPSLILLQARAAEESVLDGVFEESALVINKKYAQASADGRALKFECPANGELWKPIIYTNAGALKPDTNYVLSFYCKLKNPSEKDYLHLIVRSSSKEISLPDSLHKNIMRPTDRYLRYTFKTPAEYDYTLRIMVHESLCGELLDIKLAEGFDADFTPIDRPFNIENLTKPVLPTGACDFEVLAPLNISAPIIYAKDFGVEAGGNNLNSKLNKAIEHCKSIGASTLVLEAGAYYLDESIPIKFEGFKDFTFDGGGATFVINKTAGTSFEAEGCARVKLCNFNIDWDWQKKPLASIVEIVQTGRADGADYVDLRFVDYEVFPDKSARAVLLVPWDRHLKAVGEEGARSYSLDGMQGALKKEWRGANILRVFATDSQMLYGLKAGQQFRLQHYYYDMGNMTLTDNTHLALENINVYSCAGHAFLVGGKQKFWSMKNVNIVRPQNDSKRVITCTADHMHFSRSQGWFKMDGCEFSWGADDCINFHDVTSFVQKVSDFAVRSVNAWPQPAGAKIEFRQGDYSPANFVGTVKSGRVISFENGMRVSETVFEEKLPEQLYDGFVLFDTAYGTRNIIVKNSSFHHGQCRGILILAKDVTIENCVFERNQLGALNFSTGYTHKLWSEGYCVDNVVVRNCTFDTSNIADVKSDNYARDVMMSVYLKEDPSEERTSYPVIKNVLFENNKFADTFGLVAFISSASDIFFINNTFINSTQRKNAFEYRGSFYIEHSSGIYILNNTYCGSFKLSNAGVYIQKDTVKNVFINGNIIKK